MSNRLRIATFNVENLDDTPGEEPSLDERIAVMRPQLERLNADVLCLQEVHGQKADGQHRLLALEALLENTRYVGYQKVFTVDPKTEQLERLRNTVILSRFEITDHTQYINDPKFVESPPLYRKVTVPNQEAEEITWERPILHAKIRLDDQRVLDVINLHLKSRLPTDIPEQKVDRFTWRTASGWAEGFFISSMKRVGQALETRMLIDHLFDNDERALIAVCGDFNADSEEVPVEAIRGGVENTGNGELATRVLVPCERTIPEPARYTYLYLGRKKMIDHLLVSRPLLEFYKGSEIHNEILHDESIAFEMDVKYPESDHAPVIAEFELPDS